MRNLSKYILLVSFLLLASTLPASAGEPGAGTKRISVASSEPTTVNAPTSTARWAVSTNFADWAIPVTVNLSLQRSLGSHVSFGVEGKMNRNSWNYNDPDKEWRVKRNTLSVGMKYWPWYTWSCWWFGAKAQYCEYNVGGLWNREAEEGDAVGLALSAGYSVMLSEHWNLDFGIGGWGGHKWYTRYDCPTCGNEIESRNKFFILPDELVLSLVYVF